MLGGTRMYVEQFWKCFEQSGDIETYLGLKEYEKLYSDQTNLVITQTKQGNDIGDKDRMS